MIVILLCVQITVNSWRVATPLDIDQQGSVHHHVFYQVTILIFQRFTGIRISLARVVLDGHHHGSCSYLSLSPCEVCPLILLDIIQHSIVLVQFLGCVGHSDLVTFVDLGRTTLATAGPAAVRSAVPQLIAHHLHEEITF